MNKKTSAHDYYILNRERILQKTKEYQANHREEVRAYQRQYFQKNKEVICQRRKDRNYQRVYYKRKREEKAEKKKVEQEIANEEKRIREEAERLARFTLAFN